MFSLLAYKRNIEFWRDMWSVILKPISELPPSPMDAGEQHSPKPEHLPLEPSAAEPHKKSWPYS